jgi:predicted adenylyl cyclase CyaB
MGLEVEIAFYLKNPLLDKLLKNNDFININNHVPTKNIVIKKLKSMNAKKIGIYLFQVVIFNIKGTNKTLRLRNEGHRVTLTYKNKDLKSKYEEENEIIVNNFDEARILLHKLGFEERYSYEKIREIWNYKKCEIVFDENAGLPTLMEIEAKSNDAKSEGRIFRLAKKLGFDIEKEAKVRGAYLYNKFYGFELKNESLIYSKMKSILAKKCKKNKSILLQIIKEQMNLYKKIK